jgi:hypothetical protein
MTGSIPSTQCPRCGLRLHQVTDPIPGQAPGPGDIFRRKATRFSMVRAIRSVTALSVVPTSLRRSPFSSK